MTAEQAIRELKQFMTPRQMERDAKKSGLSYEEYLEMSYENMQAIVKAVRLPKE
jgi:hypothetical protein